MARVLVADDDTSVRELITSTLQLDKHEVEAVGTVSEAVLVHGGFAPDVMVLDINMAGGGAETILARLDGVDPGVRCPVIVVTGEAASDARHPHIVDVVRKPFSLDALRQAVSSALLRS